ncbi:glycosyltransferase family 4 protein [bacterium]|nr:glycosyltransferase family 4 protein [bacterium]
MKKLLFLSPAFDYNKGGAEYQCKILEQHLNEKYEIYYLFRHPKSLYERKYIIYDYKFRRNYNSNLYTDSLVIHRLIRRLSPDIIYKRGVNYIAAVGIHYAKSHKTKMVLHIASQRDVDKSKRHIGIKSIFNFMDQNIARYVIRNASKIICQAKYQNMLLQSNYGRSCNLVLPNFHPIPENTIKKKLPTKIVWIANFKSLKQPELFIKLAENFQDQHNAKFIMIGKAASGAWQRSLLEKMNRLSNLEYRGELSIYEVNKVLSESHIFVNTSRYEGLPNTYIQAWMRKVPVVALNSDPDDVIKTKGIGFHSKTFKQMVQDVKKLVENRKLREEMGERSQTFAFSTFTISNIHKFINLIEQT